MTAKRARLDPLPGPELTERELTASTRLPSRRFYSRPTQDVARDLLGATLCHRTATGLLAGRIVEVEAYLGEGDPAAHSCAGKTPRTAVVFGPPGHAYVYRIYGMHYCLNVVAEPDGRPGCVLVRAIQPVCGVRAMQENRNARTRVEIGNGPGKLTRALAIGIKTYGADLIAGPLTIRMPCEPAPVAIGSSPRIGITKATDLPLRYFVTGSEFVSRRRAT